MSSSSSNAKYELFSPVHLAQLRHAGRTSYSIWRFEIIFDFGPNGKAKMEFSDDSGWMEHSEWTLAGSAEFTDDSENAKKVDFHCDQKHSVYEFEMTPNGEKGNVKLYFKEINGFGLKARPWDYFQSCPETDVCLIAKETRFFHNKKLLADQSPYFKSLFFGDFCEKNVDEVVIGDVTSRDFSNFLDALNGSAIFSWGLAEFVLEYGDRFDAQIVMERTEKFLIMDNAMSKFEKLRLAEKFSLNSLQVKLFRDWSANDSMEVAKGADPHIKQLSTNMMGKLMKLGWRNNKNDN